MKTIKVNEYDLKVNGYNVPSDFCGIIEWPNGAKEWYLNGKTHRIDGPAVEHNNGTKQYWIHGEYIEDETAYWLLANIMKLKGLI